MLRNQILIITDHENYPLYRSLPLWDKAIVWRDLAGHISAEDCWGTDLALIDCGFDDARGVAALRELKAAAPKTPVIFITDAGSETTAVAAFRLGARNYFNKPFDRFELKRNIEELLTMRHSATESRSPLAIRAATGKPAEIHGLSPNILQAISYIKENLDAAISVEQLATKAAFSKYHFCRKFRQATGTSPMEFVSLMRVEKAKELLKNHPVSIVAMKVGYQDLSAFIKCFKKVTGFVPSSYKKSLLKRR